MDKQLLFAYQQARYAVRHQEQLHAFRIGEKCSLMNKLLAAHQTDSAVFITAFNPASERYPLDINLKNNQRLRFELQGKGYQYLPGIGCDDKGEWPKEESMLVFGAKIEVADRWAIEYRQNAYLVIESGLPVSLRVLSEN